MIGDGEFHRAARDGYLDPLARATRRDLNSADEDGMTPTLWAAASDNLVALRTIIGRGGSPDKCDLLGFTALHHASKNGFFEIVSFLVNYGANIWSLDNDYHTPLDIASLHDKEDIVKFLDDAQSKQQQINPKVVKKLKEKATELADENIKVFERRTRQAQKIAEKENQRRLQESDPEFKAPTKTNFFKTLTLKLKGGGGTRRYSQPNRGTTTYSDLVGTSKRGVQRKLLQKQTSTNRDEFRISEIDQDGNRTLKSMQGTRRGSDIMYMTTNREGGEVSNKGSRLPITNVFPASKLKSSKWKSESDLIDSGIDSVDSATNGYDEDEEPGVFNRPGFGKMSFLHTRKGLAGTLNGFGGGSASMDDLDVIDGAETETAGNEKRLSTENGSIGTTSSLEARMDEGLPWEEEDVEELDDDDDDSEYSPLVRFLESCGLTSYMPVFTKEDTDLDALMLLSDEDLKELGVTLGHRRKLQQAIKKRKAVLASPSAMTDTFL